jgi:hypothetical protein
LHSPTTVSVAKALWTFTAMHDLKTGIAFAEEGMVTAKQTNWQALLHRVISRLEAVTGSYEEKIRSAISCICTSRAAQHLYCVCTKPYIDFFAG